MEREKMEISPTYNEIKINKSHMVYVPIWVINFKAVGMTYVRKVLAASNTFIIEEISLSPKHFSFGKILGGLSKYEEAISCLDKAIEINPNDAYTWNNKGVYYVRQGKYEEALKFYDRAIQIDEKYIKAYFNKGIALDELSNFEEAVACYNKALEINPNDAYTWNNKGTVLDKLSKYEEAIYCYDKALEIDPKYADVWYNRACSKVKKGDIDDGLADLKKAIEIDKNKYVRMAKEDDDFQAIMSYEKFKTLITDRIENK